MINDITEIEKELIANCWVKFHKIFKSHPGIASESTYKDYKKLLSDQDNEWKYDVDPEDVWCGIRNSDPDVAFDIILKIADITSDEWLLVLLAAGPVEDLIKYHKDNLKYRTMYKKLANKDPKHKFVLSNVWL